VKTDYLFIVLIAALTLAWAVFFSPAQWYLYAVLFLLFLGVFYVGRAWPDRVFYLGCAGTLLVIAIGAVNLWAGMLMTWLVTGLILGSLGMLVTVPNLKRYLAYLAVTGVLAAGTEFSNHAAIPLVVLIAAAAVGILAMAFRDFRFRREYAGDAP